MLHPVAPSPSAQPQLLPEPPASVAKTLATQAVMFAGGVAIFAGLFEWATPFITWATTIDPVMVIPARAGAAAAVGAFGGSAAVLMESTYDTVSAAYVATKRDASLGLAKALDEAVRHQRHELPRDLMKDAATASAAGVGLGVLASFLPETSVVVSVSAVALALAYGAGLSTVEALRAVRSFWRARGLAQKGETAQAHTVRTDGYEHIRHAGRAALETITVAAVTHHVTGEVGDLVGGAAPKHDPTHAGKVVVSAAEQLPGAVESIAEVAEAFSVGVREAQDATHRVRNRGHGYHCGVP